MSIYAHNEISATYLLAFDFGGETTGEEAFAKRGERRLSIVKVKNVGIAMKSKEVDRKL